jgi:hypothetical protein
MILYDNNEFNPDSPSDKEWAGPRKLPKSLCQPLGKFFFFSFLGIPKLHKLVSAIKCLLAVLKKQIKCLLGLRGTESGRQGVFETFTSLTKHRSPNQMFAGRHYAVLKNLYPNERNYGV